MNFAAARYMACVCTCSRREGGKIPADGGLAFACRRLVMYSRSTRVLILTSTVLFVLSTIYVAASLRQLLEAFIYVPPGVDDYATLYFVNYTLPMRTLKDVVYVSLVRAYSPVDESVLMVKERRLCKILFW